MPANASHRSADWPFLNSSADLLTTAIDGKYAHAHVYAWVRGRDRSKQKEQLKWQLVSVHHRLSVGICNWNLRPKYSLSGRVGAMRCQPRQHLYILHFSCSTVVIVRRLWSGSRHQEINGLTAPGNTRAASFPCVSQVLALQCSSVLFRTWSHFCLHSSHLFSECTASQKWTVQFRSKQQQLQKKASLRALLIFTPMRTSLVTVKSGRNCWIVGLKNVSKIGRWRLLLSEGAFNHFHTGQRKFGRDHTVQLAIVTAVITVPTWLDNPINE